MAVTLGAGLERLENSAMSVNAVYDCRVMGTMWDVICIAMVLVDG